MANHNQDWEELGKDVLNIIDRAVNSRDYQKLDQSIRQVIESAVDLGSEAVRKAASTQPRSTAAPSRPVSLREKTYAQNRSLPVLYGKTGAKTGAGVMKIVGGGVLSCVSLALTITGAVLSMVNGTGFLAGGIFSLLGLSGGGLLIGSGIRRLNWLSRFKTYRKILGDMTHCTIERLARGVGKSVKFVRKELLKMIDEGLFLEGHLDNEQTSLITSDETYRYYEQSRLQLEERKRLEAAEAAKPKPVKTGITPQVQEVLDRGDAFVAQIRRCNDAIPGQEISEKISRMETIVERIFDRAEAHPEVVPDLKKLMDYYLPMTVKLLNAYADMDAQPVQGETILASKREIEATLDTLNLAFEKLLDDLFADTALDVSSDITVLNTLLAQEGLTDDELSKMKKQQN